MSKRVQWLVAVLLNTAFVCSASEMSAQSAFPDSGARIRVKTEASFPPTSGTLIGFRDDSLFMAAGKTRYAFVAHRDAIKRIDLSGGRVPTMRHTMFGGAVGAAVGAASGFVLASLLNSILPDCIGCIAEPDPASVRRRKREAVVDQTMRLGLLGLVGGVVFAYQRPPERWQRISLPSPDAQ